MKLGCFGGSVTASEEFHLALKQRSRVILPFSSALLNLNSSFVGGFRPCNNEALAGASPGAKVPLREFFPCSEGSFANAVKWLASTRIPPATKGNFSERRLHKGVFAGVFLRTVKEGGARKGCEGCFDASMWSAEGVC